MTTESFETWIAEELGPLALTGGQISFYEATWKAWQAAQKDADKVIAELIAGLSLAQMDLKRFRANQFSEPPMDYFIHYEANERLLKEARKLYDGDKDENRKA